MKVTRTRTSRRLLGTVIQFPLGTVFTDKDHKLRAYPTVELALNSPALLLVPPDEEVLSHVFKVGQNYPVALTPKVRGVYEETVETMGTPERIEVMKNICDPVPPGAKKVFVIHDADFDNLHHLAPNPSIGNALTTKIQNAARFDSQGDARIALNRFLMTVSLESSLASCYLPLSVGCALVWPSSPGTTITKRVLG